MKIIVTITLALLSAVGLSAQKPNEALDKLPELQTSQAKQGFVVATGHWDGNLYPKDSEMEITCIKARVSQVSDSRVGFCLMALAFTSDGVGADHFGKGVVGVGTAYYDIVSWGETRIIAETSFPNDICPETRQLVIDFPS